MSKFVFFSAVVILFFLSAAVFLALSPFPLPGSSSASVYASESQAWFFNESISAAYVGSSFSASFSSKGSSFSRIDVYSDNTGASEPEGSLCMSYDSTEAYNLKSSPSWSDPAYRYILLTQPASGELLTFLKNNAVRVDDCPLCSSGKVFVEAPSYPCDACGGVDYIKDPCHQCNESGYIEMWQSCGACGGLGSIETIGPEGEPISEPCGGCGGSGGSNAPEQCPGCYGKGFTELTCSVCGGGGIIIPPSEKRDCEHCKGTGYLSATVDISVSTPYDGVPVFNSELADQGIEIHDYFRLNAITEATLSVIRKAIIPEYLPYFRGLARYGTSVPLSIPHVIVPADEDPIRGYDYIALFDFPACPDCASGCDVCKGLGVKLPPRNAFSVEFILPDRTSVTKSLSVVTEAICLEIWNSSAYLKNYDFGKCFQRINEKPFTLDVSIPFELDSDGYRFFLYPKTYTLTWELNLPPNITGWCLGTVAESGEYLTDSRLVFSDVCCVDSNTYSETDIPPIFATGVLPVSLYNFRSLGNMLSYFDFEGWATDPEGKNIVYYRSLMYSEAGPDDDSIYYYFNRAYDIFYLHSDTVLYAIWKFNVFSLSYHTDGGALADNTPSEWQWPEVLSVPAPSKPDCLFMGWFLDAALTRPFENGSLPPVVSSGELELYAKFVLPQLAFRRIGANGEPIALTSSDNDAPVSYFGTSMQLVGMPLFTVGKENYVIDHYTLSMGNRRIDFFRNRVVVSWPDSPNMSVQYSSYPYTLTVDSYSHPLYADVILYDVSRGESDRTRVYFNIWEWSYKESDGSYAGTVSYLGHTSRRDSPFRNILFGDYAKIVKVSSLLEDIGLSGSRRLYRFEGDYTLQNTFGTLYLHQKGEIPYKSVNVVDIHVYANDESTQAYLTAGSISAPDIVPSGGAQGSSGGSSLIGSLFNSLSGLFQPLIVIIFLLFVVWLAFRLFDSRKRR